MNIIYYFSLSQEDEDEVDWGEDISEEAVQKRLEEISGAARSMTLSDDLEKTESERVNIFFEYVKVSAIGLLLQNVNSEPGQSDYLVLYIFCQLQKGKFGSY